MKRTFLISVLLLSVTLAACGKKEEKVSAPSQPAVPAPQAQSQGVVVTSQEGRFTLALPSGFDNPKQETVPVTTDAGPLSMTTYMAESARGLVMFSYIDYPDAVYATRSVETMLNGGRDGALQSMNATLEKEENFTFGDGNQARSIYFTLNDQEKQAFGRIDYIFVKPRLYQVGYLSHDKNEITQTDVVAYFKSFQLIK